MTGATMVLTRVSKQILLACVMVVLFGGWCFAQPAVTLSRSGGPPGGCRH